MSKIKWDAVGEKLYEVGVDRVVLFVSNGAAGYEKGVGWNGVTAVNESPSGAEPTKIYANNHTYITLLSVEELGLSIEAYTYPDEFMACDGSKEVKPGVFIGQQGRKHFGLAYRSLIGNDEDNNNHGYKIHIIYDCLASPSEKQHSTVNDSPDISPFSWEVSTTPIDMGIKGADVSASIEIDSTKVTSDALTAIENLLYGTDATVGTGGTEGTEGTEPSLPTPARIFALLDGDDNG